MSSSIAQIWFAPTFSNLLSNRRDGLFIAGAGTVHLGLYLAGLPGWSCPIRAVTGVPCPGCGLTTATGQLLHGQIARSLQTHAFAPIFLFAMGFMMLTLLLPENLRKRIITFVSHFESRSGITAWVLLTLMLYWAARLPFIL